MTSPTCARPHCRQAVNCCEEFARLSAPVMEADALSCGWRGCRRGADIADGRSSPRVAVAWLHARPMGERLRVLQLRWQRTQQPHC